jgi:hypothetical protein
MWMSSEMIISRTMEMSTEVCRVAVRSGGGGLAPILIDGPVLGLKPERVQEWLLAFPAWSLDANDPVLHCTKKLPSVEVAAQYGLFVTSLAGTLGLPVRVSIQDGQAILSLYAGRQRGRYLPLNESVLAFAAQLG